VLVLSRGGYCPRDRRQHEGLLQLHHEMQVGYCRLATISTDNLLETNEFRSGVGAEWTFLSDPARKLQKDLDRDPVGPPVNSGYLHERLPHSELHVLDAGHFIWEDAADDYAALVSGWPNTVQRCR
jgi:pimeloyl-ACP methyl ester carboxylesterase